MYFDIGKSLSTQVLIICILVNDVTCSYIRNVVIDVFCLTNKYEILIQVNTTNKVIPITSHLISNCFIFKFYGVKWNFYVCQSSDLKKKLQCPTECQYQQFKLQSLLRTEEIVLIVVLNRLRNLWELILSSSQHIINVERIYFLNTKNQFYIFKSSTISRYRFLHIFRLE